jgi:hypothetical protein
MAFDKVKIDPNGWLEHAEHAEKANPKYTVL